MSRPHHTTAPFAPSPICWRLRDIRRWMSRHRRGMAAELLDNWELGLRLIDCLIARFGPNAIWQYHWQFDQAILSVLEEVRSRPDNTVRPCPRSSAAQDAQCEPPGDDAGSHADDTSPTSTSSVPGAGDRTEQPAATERANDGGGSPSDGGAGAASPPSSHHDAHDEAGRPDAAGPEHAVTSGDSECPSSGHAADRSSAAAGNDAIDRSASRPDGNDAGSDDRDGDGDDQEDQATTVTSKYGTPDGSDDVVLVGDDDGVAAGDCTEDQTGMRGTARSGRLRHVNTHTPARRIAAALRRLRDVVGRESQRPTPRWHPRRIVREAVSRRWSIARMRRAIRQPRYILIMPDMSCSCAEVCATTMSIAIDVARGSEHMLIAPTAWCWERPDFEPYQLSNCEGHVRAICRVLADGSLHIVQQLSMLTANDRDVNVWPQLHAAGVSHILVLGDVHGWRSYVAAGQAGIRVIWIDPNPDMIHHDEDHDIITGTNITYVPLARSRHTGCWAEGIEAAVLQL